MPTPFLPSGPFGRARLRIDPLGAAQNPDAPPQAPDLVALAEQSFARPQREAPDPRSGQADDDAADHAGDAPKFGAAPASARRTLRGHGAQALSSAVDGADKPAASPDALASFSVAAPAAQQQAAKIPVRPAEKTTDQHLDDYLALSRESQEGAAESFGSIEDFVGGAQRLGAIRDWAERNLKGEEQALARQALTRRPDRAGLPALAEVERKYTEAVDPRLGPVDPAAVLRAPAYLNPEMMVLGGAALSKDPSLRAAHAEKLANRPIFASPSQKRSELQASQAVLRGELTTPARKLGDAAGQARVVKAYSGKLGSRTGLAGGYAAPFPSDVPFEPLRISGRPRSEDPLGLSEVLSGVAGDALIHNQKTRAQEEVSGDDAMGAPPRRAPAKTGLLERSVTADTSDAEIDNWLELSFAERDRLKRERDELRADTVSALDELSGIDLMIREKGLERAAMAYRLSHEQMAAFLNWLEVGSIRRRERVESALRLGTRLGRRSGRRGDVSTLITVWQWEEQLKALAYRHRSGGPSQK